MKKIAYLLPFIIVMGILHGCAFSNSSGSVSESASSISKSSGSGSDSSGSVSNSSEGSSGGGDDEVALQVMDYTAVYLTTTEFDRSAFAKGISEIAALNGIAGWEDEEAIWIGIGRGLKKANLAGRVLETYQKSLAESESLRMDGIQLGYNMQ